MAESTTLIAFIVKLPYYLVYADLATLHSDHHILLIKRKIKNEDIGGFGPTGLLYRAICIRLNIKNDQFGTSRRHQDAPDIGIQAVWRTIRRDVVVSRVIGRTIPLELLDCVIGAGGVENPILVGGE